MLSAGPTVAMKQFKLDLSARCLARAAMIAAIYAVLTRLIWAFASGAIQLRVSEVLCVLPLIFPEAVPGLFVGCLLANILGGAHILDIVFGSLATLGAAFFTWKTGFKLPEITNPKYWLSMVFPVLFNAVITGTVVWYCYGFSGFGVSDSHMLKYLPLSMLTVGAGEVISVYVLGTLLYLGLRKLPKSLLA